MNRPALAFFLAALATGAAAAEPPAPVQTMIDDRCSACHNDEDKKGGLDLTTFGYNPADPKNFAAWVKVFDRVAAGEMPPKPKPRPSEKELAAFTQALSTALTKADRARVAVEGIQRLGVHPCAQRRTAGLTEQQRGFGIDVDEDLLDRRAVGLIGSNHFLQSVEQDFQTDGKLSGAAAHATAGNIIELLAGLFDDAETGDPQAGIDAEDTKRGGRAQAGSSMTAVV